MALLNGIGKKISQTTQSAVKGTKDIAGTAKLSAQISEEKKKLNKLYYQIGKKYYELYPETADENFAEFCASVKEGYAKIEGFEDEILRIKGYKKCGGCGMDIPVETNFCWSCGFDVRVAEEPVAAPEAAVVVGSDDDEIKI